MMKERLQQGAAAVEMALITFLLVTASAGVAELGRAIYYYDTLAKSARSAARYLAQRDSTILAQQAAYRLEAKNIAQCGLPSCGVGATPLLPGLGITNISVETADTNTALANIAVSSSGAPPYYGSLDIVVVTISPANSPYVFRSLASFVIPDINFPPISVAMPRPL
jgi:Flp pilus assembly protein TadG